MGHLVRYHPVTVTSNHEERSKRLKRIFGPKEKNEENYIIKEMK
jgi:hypothetical protein